MKAIKDAQDFGKAVDTVIDAFNSMFVLVARFGGPAVSMGFVAGVIGQFVSTISDEDWQTMVNLMRKETSDTPCHAVAFIEALSEYREKVIVEKAQMYLAGTLRRRE